MLNNKVVAITGAAGRLGAAFSTAVVKAGGKVILGDIDVSKGGALEASLGKDKACFLKLDVCNLNNLDNFIKAGSKQFGKIDAAVHSAYPRSTQWGTAFGKLQEDGLKQDLFGQLGGTILTAQAFINYFTGQGAGNFIQIASIQGIAAPKFSHYEGTEMVSPVEYTAIKAGIISTTRYLAKICKGKNIRVNCISPGGILDGQPESFVNKYKSDCASKGMLDADDICGTLIFLLSEESKYINGQNLVVDDGWSL